MPLTASERLATRIRSSLKRTLLNALTHDLAQYDATIVIVWSAPSTQLEAS